MGSGYKKKNEVDMGFYVATKKEQLAYSWCINNGIYITPKPASSSTWRLLIEINKKINISPEAYKKVEIWKQLYKFYVYYYDKYANKIEVKPVKEQKEKSVKRQQTENSANNLKLF